MTNRLVVGLLFFLTAYRTANAQMSDDEAMQRLRDRQAARSAEIVSAATTQPAPAMPAAAKLVDLSTQVRSLDVEIIRRFSGSIGAMWTPAQTQEWLDKVANSAAAAPLKLVNLQADARIIVVETAPTRFQITGHLFPVGQRLALTNADKLAMKPAQTQADAAAAALAKLQFQCDDLASNRDRLAKELEVLQGNQGNSAALVQQDQIALGNLNSQLETLQPQLEAARRVSEQANSKIRALEDQHLEANKPRLAGWGPIILRTSDSALLSKQPGEIFTVTVKVIAVAVRVVRIPDLGGWDFTSQHDGPGQTHMPTASDDHGPGAIAPDVTTVIWTACDDVASAPPAAAPITLLPPVEIPSPSPSVASEPRPRPSGLTWSGSGFFISPDGLILTNRHVAQGARTLLVVYGSQQSPAEVVALDDEFDLAVIRIKPAGPLPFVTLSPMDVPNEGADCTVLGFPITDLVGNDLKITRGIVSSNSADMGGGADIMTDAKVNEGNSGGPIFDKYGNVIAVVRLKTVAKSFQESYGFGISAGHVRLFLKKNHISVPVGANGSALSTEEIVTKGKPATVFILGSD
jgi:S1-C subfamily serine protease